MVSHAKIAANQKLSTASAIRQPKVDAVFNVAS
jgi:hypothetical protein